MILGAGRLDKQIKLYEPTRTVTAGVHKISYELKYTIWANIKQITLREMMQTNVELQNETYTLYMRYKTGITNKWRVELPNGNKYRIITINTDKATGTMILGVELDNSITQEVGS